MSNLVQVRASPRSVLGEGHESLPERARHILGIAGDTATEIPWPTGHAWAHDRD